MAKRLVTIQSAHVNLLQRLAVLTPPAIVGQADANDIESRCEHLRAVNTAIMRYVEFIVSATVQNMACGARIDHGRAALVLFDAMGGGFDVIAALEAAGCRFDLCEAA